MASNVVAIQPHGSSGRGQVASSISPGELIQSMGWIPVALSAALIVSGLVGRKKSALAFALTACAGTAVLSAGRGIPLHRGGANEAHAEPEAKRVITIGKPADALRQRWLDSRTLPQLMAGFATLHPIGDNRMRWEIRTPLGRLYQWESEIVDQPGGSIAWRSLPGAAIANEGSVRFDAAPNGRGTVATLHVRFDPPGGALGQGLVQLLGATPVNVIADNALRRFKSLVETGEIPTTERQPAARETKR
ncbi:SRPBCC family protein [Caballeronia sp. AZ10_KS36]|uniref:SRPBCC family protein n=1 Tax=Caballeronia sp. AZ10_KS36 TaxID=2921757 RepID=UPI0020280DAF|nr:SRPBCC family protein [Caballeronia sp. AZ10_KS36]